LSPASNRITLDGDHFYIDLVFYHTVLKCHVLLDLKVGKRLLLALTTASMGPQLFSCGNNLVDQLHRHERRASMGPQLFSCGNESERLHQRQVVGLQWGRSFSAAEIIGSQAALLTKNALQWGRSFSAAEIVPSISIQ